jgi:endonuclease-8
LAQRAAQRLAQRPDRELGLALLDQTVMAGVGNLYRAEICFLLGASPWTPVAEVDPLAAVELAHRLLARNAWRPQQSTTGELHGGAQTWVYGRTGRACLRCGTAIRSASVGEPDRPAQERVVYFCPVCQPLPAGRRSGTTSDPTSGPMSGPTID